MSKQLATLAIAALLGAPFAVNAETYNMHSDDQIQPDISEGDRVDTIKERDKTQTIKAEIVEIDGDTVWITCCDLPERRPSQRQ